MKNPRATAQILWLAFVVSPLTIGGVGAYLTVQRTLPPEPLPAVLIPILLGLALFGLAAAVVLHRRPLSKARPGLPPTYLLSLGLAESCTVFGFVLSFLASDPRFAIGCGISSAAVVLLLLRPPAVG